LKQITLVNVLTNSIVQSSQAASTLHNCLLGIMNTTANLYL